MYTYCKNRCTKRFAISINTKEGKLNKTEYTIKGIAVSRNGSDEGGESIPEDLGRENVVTVKV